MKNKITLSLLLGFTLTAILFISSAHAQEKRVITLSDGTRISGKVSSYNNGIYTIQTENLGELKIKDSSVVNIGSGGSTATTDQTSNPNTMGMGSQDMKSTVAQMQASMMQDPAMMQEIMKLVEDPEIMALLQDQNFVNDIMSYDPNRIQSNPKVQRLMNNPRMRQMMQMMMGQMPNR